MKSHESPSREEVISKEEAIFYDALQIADDAKREVFLQEACGTKRTLRAAVDDLLSSHERADGFFRESSAVLKPPTELAASSLERGTAGVDVAVGSCIGPYEIVQRLGEGGSGVVYMAQQETPVRRLVAIKILKLGMDTKRVIARFEAERQTLAMMEHPNIAHVLDAGATETGRPYFVMELVRGLSITDFCAEKGVSLVERLRLFQQVCQAVQHAHQKGIIHRDLKPSNILVAVDDGVPIPKVIDFGIAKAIGEVEPGTHITVRDHLIGTPAYMSPEQAQGGSVDVDTRSDIYSLGVVLYELLAGRPPFRNEDLLGGGLDEMRRRLQSDEPLRPSRQAELGWENKTPATPDSVPGMSRWFRSLQGDLDWIAMKALEKDRDRRYQTVRGLWLDIQRYLTNEAVDARPPSRLYRLQKMVHRNKVLFASITSAALALIAGLATSTWLFLKAAAAERQQKQMRAVAEQALRQEAILRKQAENRERIAQAAILLVHRKYDEADAAVRQLPNPFTEPSVEAANLFRALAEWNALRQDWHAAVERVLTLLEVNRFDDSNQTDVVTRDLVVAAPTLIEAGQLARYEEMRSRAIEKFANTTSTVAAEQVMKTSLLVPFSPEILQALEVMAKTQESGIAERSSSVVAKGWGSAVLGLFEYRRGSYEKAVNWCTLSRASSYRNKAHLALCLLVEAMSQWKLHQESAARDDLAQAQQLIDTWFARPSRSAEAGAWNDWLIARILLREARGLIE